MTRNKIYLSIYTLIQAIEHHEDFTLINIVQCAKFGKACFLKGLAKHMTDKVRAEDDFKSMCGGGGEADLKKKVKGTSANKGKRKP